MRAWLNFTASHIISLIEKEFNIGLGPDIADYALSADAEENVLWINTDGFVPLDADDD